MCIDVFVNLITSAIYSYSSPPGRRSSHHNLLAFSIATICHRPPPPRPHSTSFAFWWAILSIATVIVIQGNWSLSFSFSSTILIACENCRKSQKSYLRRNSASRLRLEIPQGGQGMQSHIPSLYNKLTNIDTFSSNSGRRNVDRNIIIP
jgi:hypothetical protein